MKLRYKILNSLLGLLVIAAVSLGLLLSHNSACEPPAAAADQAQSIRAIVYTCYGSPEVLKLARIDKPVPGANEVLVKVHNASVNPLDWHYMRGSPYFMRLSSGIGAPANQSFGADFAGTVETVGPNVTKYQPGDEVFGGRTGAFGEYVVIGQDRALAAIPPGVTLEQAATVPIAGVSALQALRDQGKVTAGMPALINGASGGVGTFAVQIAKAMGAEVTGVCSDRNVEMVRSLGADHVIDYRKQDYTTSGETYDVIIDNVGNHSPRENSRALVPGGKLVMVGGPSGDWIGPLANPLKAALLSPFSDKSFILFMAELNPQDLAQLAGMIQSGELTPVIDRRYGLSEVPAAVGYSEEGRARGKILVTIP